MSSSTCTSDSRKTSEFSKKICSLLLQVLSSDKFCVFRLQADTLKSNEFVRSLLDHGFEFASNLLELVLDIAEKRWKESCFTSVFGAMD